MPPLEDIILATVVKEVTERLLKNKRLKKKLRRVLRSRNGKPTPKRKRKQPAQHKKVPQGNLLHHSVALPKKRRGRRPN